MYFHKFRFYIFLLDRIKQTHVSIYVSIDNFASILFSFSPFLLLHNVNPTYSSIVFVLFLFFFFYSSIHFTFTVNDNLARRTSLFMNFFSSYLCFFYLFLFTFFFVVLVFSNFFLFFLAFASNDANRSSSANYKHNSHASTTSKTFVFKRNISKT